MRWCGSADAPLSYITQERFSADASGALVLGMDEPFDGAIEQTSREYEDHPRLLVWLGTALTVQCERGDPWAITLQLQLRNRRIVAAHNYVDTGSACGRNWDSVSAGCVTPIVRRSTR